MTGGYASTEAGAMGAHRRERLTLDELDLIDAKLHAAERAARLLQYRREDDADALGSIAVSRPGDGQAYENYCAADDEAHALRELGDELHSTRSELDMILNP